MTAPFRLACAVAVLVLPPARLLADITIVETVTTRMGGQSAQGIRTTHIKGSRMRVEQVAGGTSSATLFDLPAGTIVSLDTAKNRAEVHSLSARTAELEQQYPRQRASAMVAPAGATKEIAGQPCTEYTFTIKVPMTKDGEPSLIVAGTAWMAPDAPGADDYASFVKAANEKQLIVGYVSDNKILLAEARGQTELYRALGALHGIPYAIDMTMTFDGHGMLTRLLNKTAGARTSAVTRVGVDPIADAMFAIPDGWKRDVKK